jgi:hypothetical protein
MTYICPLLGHAYTIYEKVTVQWTDGTSCEEITGRTCDRCGDRIELPQKPWLQDVYRAFSSKT